MEVREASSDLSEWDQYVLRNPLASQYHLGAWKWVIERSFGHVGRYLITIDGTRIVGILPLVVMKSLWFGRFVVSVPFVNYGGIAADHARAEQALLEAAQTIAKEEGAQCIELRHQRVHGLGLQARQHKVTMIMELQPDRNAQWKAFDPKLRNQIRKAEKSGLTAQIGGSELLPVFYGIFAQNMRDLGTPVYSRRFFEQVLEAFPDSSRIVLVRAGEGAVAGAMALGFRDTMEVPWAASLRPFRWMCPNNLLYWALIQQAIKDGYRRFDFGRSTPGEGTYRFKEQWGARPVPLAWEYWLPNGGPLPDISPKNARYHLALQVWKHLPLSVTKWLGPAIVRGIP